MDCDEGMMKKTILLVHNFYKQPGGEDTVFYNEKELLEQHGHKVVTYTRTNEELDGMNKLQKVLLPFTVVFSLKTYNDIRRIIKKEKVDVVHVHNTLTLISPSVYYAALSLKVPVVQTMHNFRLLCSGATFYKKGHVCEQCVRKGLTCGIRGRCYRDSLSQSLMSAFILMYHRMRGIYRKINYICLTEFNKEKLLELNNRKKLIDENKIYIKPNFTVPEKIEADVNQEEYYIYVARLEAIKGIKLVVKAFKENGRKLIVLGSGNQEEEVRKYIEKNKADNITLLGHVEKDTVMKMLSSAKALIVASQWYETFGMTVIEAYSVATPVIAGDIGNIGNIVKEGITGYKYTYYSYKALNEAIDVFERSDISALKKNAYDEYEKYYSKEMNYQILNDIYEDVK